MKKMGLAFTALTALLLFAVSFEQFNLGYKVSQSTLFKEAVLDGDLQVITFNLSAESFNGSIEGFEKSVVELFQNTPYDGYVRDDSNKSYNMYLSTSNPDALKHLALSKDVTDFDFRAPTESRFISNSINQADASAYVLQFDRTESIPNSNDFNMQVNYYPIAQLSDSNHSKNQANKILILSFFVPVNEVDHFKDSLLNDYFGAEFSCPPYSKETESICGALLQLDSKTTFKIDEMMRYPINQNPFEYPNSILILAFFSLFTVLISISVAREREINIRQMHGNYNYIIFKRIFLNMVLSMIGVFALTLAILSAFRIGFFNRISYQYLYNLFKMLLYFIAIISLTTFLFYIFQKLNMSVHKLKSVSENRFIDVLIPIFKITSIIIVLVPLVSTYYSYSNTKDYVKALNQQDDLVKGTVVNNIHYGFEASIEQQDANNDFLFKKVEEYDLDFISSEHIMAYGETYSYLITNRNALSREPIYTTNGEKLNVKNISVNSILIPESSSFIPNFDNDVNIIHVVSTPTIFAPYNMENQQNVIINAPIYVVIDPSEQVLSSINYMSIISTEATNLNLEQFSADVAQEIIEPITILRADLLSQIENDLDGYRNGFIALFGNILLLSISFTTLVLESSFSRKGSLLAIRYIHGQSWFSRYKEIIGTLIIALSIPFVFILLSSASKVTEFVPMINMGLLTGFFAILLVVDIIITYFSIRRFERKHLLATLKGDI